jgi:solute carrier family 25 phosphate transporter 23/24/25/41
MQMQGFGPDHPVYGTTWNAIKTMWKKDSYHAFYKGLIPNYLKVVPSISISFVTYEYCKKSLGG